MDKLKSPRKVVDGGNQESSKKSVRKLVSVQPSASNSKKDNFTSATESSPPKADLTKKVVIAEK